MFLYTLRFGAVLSKEHRYGAVYGSVNTHRTERYRKKKRTVKTLKPCSFRSVISIAFGSTSLGILVLRTLRYWIKQSVVCIDLSKSCTTDFIFRSSAPEHIDL